MVKYFEEELGELNKKLLQMCALVEEAISRSVNSLVQRDSSMADKVFTAEETINRLEIDIEELCLKLLALHQPAAIDLRFITAAMKMNNDLERIGDLAVNIAECAQEIIKQPPLKPLIDIPRMASLAQGMVKDSIDALVKRDELLARSVCKRDDEVDSLNDQVFRELLTYIMQDPKTTSRAVQLILVARHLERMADHATNIAEDVIYFLKGKTIKHHIEDKRV
jgi:phosphate transport system protein